MWGYYPLLFIGIWVTSFIIIAVATNPAKGEVAGVWGVALLNALAWVLIVASLKGLFT